MTGAILCRFSTLERKHSGPVDWVVYMGGKKYPACQAHAEANARSFRVEYQPSQQLPLVMPPAKAPKQFQETKKAIGDAGKHADPVWIETAYSIGVDLAKTSERFTSADIDLKMQRDHVEIFTHEKRAMGAIMRRLLRERVIEKTETIVQDPRPNCHNQNKRVMRSLVFEGRAK